MPSLVRLFDLNAEVAAAFTPKSLTRSALNSLASNSTVTPNQLYLITDEKRLAVGLTTATYQDYALLRDYITGLKALTETTVALGTVTSNFVIDFSQGTVFTVTIGAAVQMSFANLVAGAANSATVYITNGGAYAWTYATAVKQAGGTALTFSTSGEDIVTYITPDGTTGNMHAVLGGKAFS